MPATTALNQPVAAPAPPAEAGIERTRSAVSHEARAAANKKNEVAASVPPTLKAPESPSGTAVARRQSRDGKTVVGLLADRKRSDLPVDSLSINGLNVESRPESSAEKRPIGGVSETVEVTAAAPAISTEQAQAVQAKPSSDRLMARADELPPITKAKPPAKTAEKAPAAEATDKTGANMALSYTVVGGMVAGRAMLAKDVVAQWSLSQGVLRRSFDGGTSWQSALQLEHPLLSFGALGREVWAGGQAGTLFHSTDNGMTWTQIQPSIKGDALKADIVAIDIHSPTDVALSTSNQESWTTADGGKTWENKTSEKK